MALDFTPTVLSIQSHVVHGYVGNKSAVFPLQVLGFEVDFINTVQFSTHTGYKHIKGSMIQNDELTQIVEGLSLNDVDYYTYFLTGYSRNPEAMKQVAELIKTLRKKNPNLIYVCDPVMGDNGKMYVPEEVFPVYRDILLPLADIITPNQFEAERMTGLKMNSLESAMAIVKALHDKGVKTVVLSSTDLGDEKHMIGIASSGGTAYMIRIPKLDINFTGSGDLFAALFLAWWHKTNNDVKLTLEKTIATLFGICSDTYNFAKAKQPHGEIHCKLKELRLVQNKSIIENPNVQIQAVEIDCSCT